MKDNEMSSVSFKTSVISVGREKFYDLIIGDIPLFMKSVGSILGTAVVSNAVLMVQLALL